MGQQLAAEWTLGGEVAICLVDDDYTFEGGDYLVDLVAVEGIASGVVGRTEPDEFGVLVGGGEEFVGIELETLFQAYCAIFHIVDVGK